MQKFFFMGVICSSLALFGVDNSPIENMYRQQNQSAFYNGVTAGAVSLGFLKIMSDSLDESDAIILPTLACGALAFNLKNNTTSVRLTLVQQEMFRIGQKTNFIRGMFTSVCAAETFKILANQGNLHELFNDTYTALPLAALITLYASYFLCFELPGAHKKAQDLILQEATRKINHDLAATRSKQMTQAEVAAMLAQFDHESHRRR